MKALHFEKKKQKLLLIGACLAATQSPIGKSFLVLFFKKELLSPYIPK
jgi:hypothetical protein